MRIRVVAAREGLTWIRDGVRLFGRHPLSLLGSGAAWLLIVLLPILVPVAGPAITAVLAPIASLGLISACRAVDAGRTPGLGVYAEGLRVAHTRRSLLVLGAINALIVLPLAAIVHATGLDQAVTVTSGPGQPKMAVDPGLLALRVAVSTPILMAMWLAPPLVAWEGLSAAKAMFYSFFACWRNRWPLLTFIAGVMATGSAATIVLVAFLVLLLPGQIATALLIAPLFLALLAVVQGGVYRMYMQVVHA
jgi:hypothetical protein